MTALLLGWRTGRELWQLVAWVAVVFVSVLVHELGHAVVGHLLGGEPEIRLEGFGGNTVARLRKHPGALRRIALSVAGPLFGLLPGLLAVVFSAVQPADPESPSAWVVGVILYTSVAWTILNLLPMLPLDGGNILLAGVEGVRGKPSDRGVAWFSAGFAVLLSLAAWLRLHDLYLALFGLVFAYQNFVRARASAPSGPQAPQAPEPPRIDPLERADVERGTGEARRALLAKDVEAALGAAAALEEGAGPFRQAAGLRLRAGIELSRGDNHSAAMLAGQSFTLWPSADAAVVAARANLRTGERERALNWLRRAVEAGAPLAAVRDDPELSVLA